MMLEKNESAQVRRKEELERREREVSNYPMETLWSRIMGSCVTHSL